MTKTTFLTGVAVGAGLAFFLDGEHGAGRRSRVAARLDRLRIRYGRRLGDIVGLEGANLPPPPEHRVGRIAGTAAGGALMIFGLSRRGALASAARAVGAGLLARGLRRDRDPDGEQRRVVDIQQSIHIAVPLSEVYAVCASPGIFPLIISNLRKDQEGGRQRWLVTGPLGGSLEWDGGFTERRPDQLVAWRSREGSSLSSAGVIRLTPEHGGTRVDLRLCYRLPPGAADQEVHGLLGTVGLGRLRAAVEGRQAGGSSRATSLPSPADGRSGAQP